MVVVAEILWQQIFRHPVDVTNLYTQEILIVHYCTDIHLFRGSSIMTYSSKLTLAKYWYVLKVIAYSTKLSFIL